MLVNSCIRTLDRIGSRITTPQPHILTHHFHTFHTLHIPQQVEWSDVFTLQVNTASVQPCYGYMGVRVTKPHCLRETGREKVRVYAHFRANVTSANPPIKKR